MSELWQLSASDIAQSVRSGALSAETVTQAHLDRLDDVNPTINAVVQECPQDALNAARAVDAQVAQGIDPGPLCGVPVTIKIIVDQAGFATSNGLKLRKDLIAETDSPVVSNIVKAGGVVVGRTNTPAFSLRWFTKNDLHGQTLNPRNAALTPGGSSGGAAAAVASGICAIGHGTDIGGSIRYPAYACGLHGLRPTLGRVPAYNASGSERFIGAQLMAVSGPIARTIADIRLSLAAMAAPDVRDPWYVPAPIDLGAFPKRAVLAVAPDGMTVAPEVQTALRKTAKALEDSGWSVEEIPCPPMQPAADINAQLWLSEMRSGEEEMIAKENEPDSMYVFENMSKRSEPVDLDGLMAALRHRATLVRDWQLFLEKYPVLLCPISGMTPFVQQQDVSSPAAFEEIMQAQLPQLALPTLGLPGLAVATDPVGNIPMGVQLIGGRYREDILLAAGADIERANAPVRVTDPQ